MAGGVRLAARNQRTNFLRRSNSPAPIRGPRFFRRAGRPVPLCGSRPEARRHGAVRDAPVRVEVTGFISNAEGRMMNEERIGQILSAANSFLHSSFFVLP
jgi:hypothetical protein